MEKEKKIYAVKVKVTFQVDDEGKEKSKVEHYLVEGVSVTDAEKIMYSELETYTSLVSYEVKSVQETKFVDFLAAK